MAERFLAEESKTPRLDTSPTALRILEQFGYMINQDSKLVNAETGDGFSFISQEHYDRLGELIA
jgi:hypothetical protein